MLPALAFGQSNPYTTALTPYTGQWPSINSKGALVWSQLDANGYWQVWTTKQNSPFGGPPAQITTGNQNHERPIIDDKDDIVYFQDNTGQGAGWEVILQPPGGSSSVLEYSSANPPTCKPPNDPTCKAWHTAGQNFGIAANGTTITYYDFCTPGPSCVRRFDVSGIGTLQCSGSSCDFWGYDYPTINSNGQLAYEDSAGDIYYTTTASPAVPGTQFGSGLCPLLADGLTNSNGALDPQIVFVQSSAALCPVYAEQEQGLTQGATQGTIESNFLLNTSAGEVTVVDGVSASVNNSGAIVYQAAASNTSQIGFAGNTNGVDLSEVPSDWPQILTEYAPQFVVADAWGGCTKKPAYDILSGALLADQELRVSSYAVLNLLSGSCPHGIKTLPPAQQMARAMTAVGSLASSLKFVAVDLEHGHFGTTQTDQTQNVKSIKAAIKTLQGSPYNVKRVIIYASCNDWVAATGNDTTIAGSGVLLWSPRYDNFPDLFDDKDAKTNPPCLPATGIVPWPPFGGWSGRLGKQYLENVTMDAEGYLKQLKMSGGCNPRVESDCTCENMVECAATGFVDLDVFDLSLFQ